MVQHLSEHGVQRVFDSENHMGRGVVLQHDKVPFEHAAKLSSCGTKVLEISTTALIRVLER
jgi:hypothetical protein